MSQNICWFVGIQHKALIFFYRTDPFFVIGPTNEITLSHEAVAKNENLEISQTFLPTWQIFFN